MHIILLSGGLDSLVALAQTLEKTSDVALLHCHYGQKNYKKEQESFKKMNTFFCPNAPILSINLEGLKVIGGSPLNDSQKEVKDFSPSAGISLNYVPFRNTHLIATAVSWAEVINAHAIVLGTHQSDESGFPDCRPAYYLAMQELIRQGSNHQNIKLVTPFIHKTKAEIIKEGVRLKVPFEMSWSCYNKTETPCQKCEACYERAKAFQLAGTIDPLFNVQS